VEVAAVQAIKQRQKVVVQSMRLQAQPSLRGI